MGRWRLRLGAAVLTAACFACLVRAAAGDQDGAAPAAPPAGTAPPAAVKAPGATVRIVFTVLPSSKKATVSWGKKKLGVIAPHAPLIVQRPRDSGPLDVIVRADGCIPVQTRAYTFEDSKVAVHVTPNDQKNTLLGYREEQPAADGGVAAGNPDGGAR
jgi:hypothetical protein